MLCKSGLGALRGLGEDVLGAIFPLLILGNHERHLNARKVEEIKLVQWLW